MAVRVRGPVDQEFTDWAVRMYRADGTATAAQPREAARASERVQRDFEARRHALEMRHLRLLAIWLGAAVAFGLVLAWLSDGGAGTVAFCVTIPVAVLLSSLQRAHRENHRQREAAERALEARMAWARAWAAVPETERVRIRRKEALKGAALAVGKGTVKVVGAVGGLPFDDLPDLGGASS